MTAAQWWIGVLGELILLALLVGLIVKGGHRACYSFTLYVAAVLVPDVMVTAWPARFYVWEFWMLKEIAHNLLKFAIALELAIRTFRAFPGARATARGIVFLVVLVCLAGVLAAPGGPGGLRELATDLHPRILNGTIWLFTAIAAVILWYRLPIQALHKAILIGFVPYLLIFTVAMSALDAVGWHIQDLAAYAHTIAYLALLCYWTYAAWRPQEALQLSAGARHEVAQPG